MENSTKKTRKKKGFTLVELVIVLAVMGIIALIAIPSLAGTKENFKIKSDKKSCETIKRAIEIIALDDEDALVKGTYLATWDATTKKVTTVTKDTDGDDPTASTIQKSLKDTNAAQTEGSHAYLIDVSEKGKTIKVSVVDKDNTLLNNIKTK